MTSFLRRHKDYITQITSSKFTTFKLLP